MGRIVECPKCGVDISDIYEGYDPSVGIIRGSWFCDVCDETVTDEDGPDEPDYDAKPFRETYLEAWNEHQRLHRR